MASPEFEEALGTTTAAPAPKVDTAEQLVNPLTGKQATTAPPPTLTTGPVATQGAGGEAVDSLAQELHERLLHQEREVEAAQTREKISSLVIGIGATVAICLLMLLVVNAVTRNAPPQNVAYSGPPSEEASPESETMNKPELEKPVVQSAAAAMTMDRRSTRPAKARPARRRRPSSSRPRPTAAAAAAGFALDQRLLWEAVKWPFNVLRGAAASAAIAADVPRENWVSYLE